nr:enoyl-CoA hydratase/isomerase family protein [Actibacterium sp. 188UL27-1]
MDRRGNGTEALWTLTIDRTDKANALRRDMLQEILTIFEAAAAEQIGGLILTGAGTVFSAGADLDQAKVGLATDQIWERVSARLASLDCMTIAALNGTLAGGAFGMALACDLRISVPSAKFFYPVMQLGFAPQPSDPQRMTALIGPSKTRLILMASERIDAATALDWGLIDRITEPDSLLPTAHAWIEPTLAAPLEIRRKIKRMCP